MKTFLPILLLAACSAPRTATGLTQGHHPVAVQDVSSMTSTPANAGDGGVKLSFDEAMTIWLVVNGECHSIYFSGPDRSSRFVLVSGPPGMSSLKTIIVMSYAVKGNRLDIDGMSQISLEDPVGQPSTWSCRTTLRVGPGRTLGGANIYDSKKACLAALSTAIPLDDSFANSDSPKETSAKCRTIDEVPVVTDTVECKGGDDITGDPRAGCISKAFSEDTFW